MNRLLYFLHKWISTAAFVQLAIWTVSGSVFAWVSQESIRSTPVEGAHHGVITGAPRRLRSPARWRSRPRLAPSIVSGAARRTVELAPTTSSTVTGAILRVDARSGELAPVSRAEAELIARRDQPDSPPVRGTTLIESSPPVEYRDCEHTECTLPVYQVALADPAGTVLYVDAATGDVTARRNDRWRLYDFFWSLHIAGLPRSRGLQSLAHPRSRSPGGGDGRVWSRHSDLASDALGTTPAPGQPHSAAQADGPRRCDPSSPAAASQALLLTGAVPRSTTHGSAPAERRADVLFG